MDKQRAIQIVKDYEALKNALEHEAGLEYAEVAELTVKDDKVQWRIAKWDFVMNMEVPEYLIEQRVK